MNWGADEPTPLLVCDEIGSRQDAADAALQMLVNAGLLTPDDRLEAFLRSSTGLPDPDPDTAREPDPAVPDPGADPNADPATTPNESEPQPDRRTPGRRRANPEGAMTLWGDLQ